MNIGVAMAGLVVAIFGFYVFRGINNGTIK